LANRAASGDSAAFTVLVRRYERRVRAFLMRLSRGEGADDLAQEVFLIAWRKAGAFQGMGSYEGWLLKIAWRQFLSRVRATRQEQWMELPDGRAGAADPTVGLDIDRALGGLTADERAAALLCLGEGYSHSEAARILDVPLGTLKSIVARARSKLAANLGGTGDDG